MHILLWDIDGTLIRSGSAGKQAMEMALSQAFGVSEVRNTVSFSGRTDPWIVPQLLAENDLPSDSASVDRLIDAYLDLLPSAMVERRGVVLPQVVDILERLARTDGVVLGLLTGNVKRGAETKLRHFGLWDYFRFGGFADGIPDRGDVARHALRQAEAHTGSSATPGEVWVIGDTPHDVACGRVIGAKTVALATGWHPLEELHLSGADYVLPDLTHADELMALWMR